MQNPLSYLVFTDLDGTLLDHETYAYEAARPALDALREIEAGVVLASSKTGAEIAELRSAMGLDQWPAIIENGGGILAPAGGGVVSDEYQKIRKWLNELPANLRENFRGFGDMTSSQVMAATGLSAESAELAKQRAFSEPGVWSGSEHLLDEFLSRAQSVGIVARRGGRFLTLGFGQTKADRMAEIIAALLPRKTIALGDAPNDVEMIEAADFGVIVKNPHARPLPKLPKEEAGCIVRTQESGPVGWNRAILSILSKEEMHR